MNPTAAITLATVTPPASFGSSSIANAAGGASMPFSSLLKDATTQVESLEQQAHATAVGLMTGSGVDVHQAVIAQQKAAMAFELALSVRNKAVQAYQSVMGMQF
ncbi:MAG TPA: flagellar hook-basal body complex protein FliE [Terracidiphilus sp.]|nr:flagellar hook-basal body complex protein FliE [Terracidiphilus sp.]HEX4285254.1 flagellar hook-basal body complex protein FliE [Terracidiphilus sp.]